MLRIYLLVSCICVLIAAVFYTFYWNRIISGFISLLLRVKYWRQGGSSIWVHIGSIHFSILAGRILLKDVKYYSSNMTVKIVTAQISWRYWLRVPATEDDLNHAHVGGEDFNHASSFPSCRIKVSVQGFEWFLYNKTAAYDHIISQMQTKTSPRPEPSEPRRMFSRTSAAEGLGFYPPPALANIKAPPLIHAALAWIKRQTPYLDPNDILPIALELSKVAITCGNPSTPSLLVAECHRAEGTFGIVQARSKCDLYKQLLNLKFQNVLVQLVENDNFQGNMPTIGHRIREKAETSSRFLELVPLGYLPFRAFSRIWKGLKLYSSGHGSSVHDRRAAEKCPGPMPSRKSTKSIDEDTPVGADFATLEYAIERRIIEAPILELSYYTDIVGDVSDAQDGPKGMGLESYDIGNGDLPPEWGVDLVIRNGTIRYGPWADRQRVHLQRTFFPPTYHDLEVSKHLRPGDKRTWTAMKVFFELRDKTVLYVPFREPSKNWQWDGISEYSRPRKRDHAALHCTAGDSSSISYLLPMVTGPDGYEPRLEVHLDTVSVTSSLNDIKLIAAESCRVHASFPSPLVWNAERRWSFSISLRQPVIYFLRDHVNMFTDLARDWTFGPPTECNIFVPTVYTLELDLHHFELNLYANDQNIIDKPLVKGENTLVTIRAPRLNTQVTFPSNKYRPEATSIPFVIDIPDVTVFLSLPRWNTQYLYNSGKEHRIIHAAAFHITSSYYFWADVQADNIDQLKLTVETSRVTYKALGWSARCLMVLRDNYFGSFTHFSTLVEYLDKRSRFGLTGDPLEMKHRPGKSNSLQVQVSIQLQSGSMLLPAGLPGYEVRVASDRSFDDIGASTVLACSVLQLDLRLHDYFMDASLNLHAIRGSVLDACSEHAFFGQGHLRYEDSILIDGLNITANRLFGPQPRTRTYVCVWEIGVGPVKALLTSHDGQILLASLNAVRLNYTDLANAPATEFGVPVDPDATFIRFSTSHIDATWSAGATAVNLSLPSGLSVHTNDLEGQFCGKLTSVRLPIASLKILLSSRDSKTIWCEAADLSTDINLDIYRSPKTRNPSQMDFIKGQDELTHRAQYLLDEVERARSASLPDNWQLPQRTRSGHHRNGFYLPPPRLPYFCRAKPHPLVPPTSVPHSKNTTAWWPRLSYLSESDGEENISEADRDARLARSRLAPPTTVDDDMSVSGEESDNEDLTDTESSISGWSSTRSGTRRHSLIKRYRRVTRWYQSINLDDINGWEDSPFVVTKVISKPPFSEYSSIRNQEPRITAQKDKNSSGIRPAVQANERVSYVHSTTFRVQCKREITVRITPLVLLGVRDIIEDLQSRRLSPELTLDLVMASHIVKFGDSPGPPLSTAFDICIRSARLQVLEHISYPSSSYKETSAQRDSMVTINCLVSGCHLAMSQGAQKLACHLEISETSIRVTDDSGVALGSKRSLGHSPILSLRRLQLDATQNHASISAGRFAVELQPASLECAVATFQALEQDLQDLSLDPSVKFGPTTRLAEIVYHTLDLTQGRAAVDPLSTIQPSFLVQRGHPQALRTHATYKFIFHLRTALQFARLQGDIGANSTGQSIAAHDVNALVNACVAELMLDLDSSKEGIPSPLEMIHPRTSPKSTISARLIVDSVNFTADLVSVIIADELLASTSRLDISSCALRLRSSKLVPLEGIQLQSQSPSLANHDTTAIPQTACTLSIGDVNVTVSPHLMVFAQSVLRLRRVSRKWVPVSNQALPNSGLSHLIFTVAIRRVNIRAAAEKLAFEIGATDMDIFLTSLKRVDPLMRTEVHSVSYTAGFTNAFIRARATSIGPGIWARDQDILASLTFSSGKLNVLWRQELSASTIRLAFLLSSTSFSVPRSALRLYRFVEEWQADFFPGIEAATRAFLAELKEGDSVQQTALMHPRAVKRNALAAHVTGRISELGVSLQVMRGTWLSWNIHDLTVFLSSPGGTGSRPSTSFGIQFGSQTLGVSYKLQSTDDHTDTPHIKVKLPSLSLTGRYGRAFVRILASVDFFDVLIKPSHWDTLLVVQQKFGQDFSDLMDLIQQTRQRTSNPSGSTSIASRSSLSFSGHVNVKGFRLGLEGRSSTSYLECEDVGGDISSSDSGIAWRIRLRDLALSLAPRAGVVSRETTFNRNHRSAFLIVDLRARGDTHKLDFRVPKIHAVMQPSSIGEVGDFLDHQQAELLIRRDQRAAELAAFKEKTRSVLKTFDIRTSEAIRDQKPSWLSERTIDVVIQKIGVAFPLSLEQTLELPRTSSRDSPSVRAFLFAVRRIKFSAQRGEAGEMSTRDLSFQFVPSFRQSSSEDFAADKHRSRNRLVYPHMTARLRSDTSLLSRHIWFSGIISGFILDLDSNIPDYIFSLIDVYRQGRERMIRIAASLPRATTSHADLARDDVSLRGGQQNVPASSIFANLVFQSGEVRVHTDAKSTQARPLGTYQSSDGQLRPEQETLRLPVISAWVEYRASGIRAGPAALIFKSTIHSSQNILRPSLLPFMTEIVNYVQLRLRKTSRGNTLLIAPSPAEDEPSPLLTSSRMENLSEASSSLQISFNLRIDKSTLELTCQPDVNVVAALRWESGGFLMNISPGAHNVTLTGTVDGLTIGLKHGFLSDDCVNIAARNLAFFLAFAKNEDRMGNIDSTVSLVVDTDISGGVRFSRLQDVLCFKAVWLDRIPLFVAEHASSDRSRPPTASSSSVTTPVVKQEVTTTLIIRIRQIHLDVDLGQSISSVTLDLQSAVTRMRFSEMSTEVSLSVANVSILARGNVAGHMNVPDCVFQTIRRNEGSLSDDSRTARMLELSMTSGPLSAELESDHQRLLIYRADPVQVDIHDDWSLVSSADRGQDRPLLLTFTVNGEEIIVLATIATIPKLLMYVNKFQANIAAQRDGASHESAAFRATQSPKPDNPLTEVASAFFHSARNRFKEADAELSHRIRQQLSFRLETLRLVLFPRTMGDTELAQFIGRDVHASLERVVIDENPPHREIRLSFTALTISKFSQPQPLLSPTTVVSDGKAWVDHLFKHPTEANIVGLPTMNMLMFTDEVVEELVKYIDYRFYSSFVRGKGTKEHEDIYITLNVALYSWLTGLRKNLTRELEQVQGSQDSRNATAGPSSRKRAGNTEPPPGMDVAHMDASSPTSTASSPSVPEKAPSPGFKPSAVSPQLPSELSAHPLLPTSQARSLPDSFDTSAPLPPPSVAKTVAMVYRARDRVIERLTMRQLGEATPDVMHPFFMKTAGFNLEDSLPQYVHEYATIPLEEIMEALLKLYSKQLRTDQGIGQN
ncbi:hypothetical protein DEU56DRAFT_37144 [Suillus clintonianus]|uniref:uncharacterized protein n=1 Tax=Suillus clintonianus TaxID=1904413 RepID=UPI001B866B80|nr:uncharacterized protein DEU56DRAFT_37144 [Suillus clintonianus]KAG2150597.1 hypothetical protein DEU56DRAFT_37144 [Suillus clintonianus]